MALFNIYCHSLFKPCALSRLEDTLFDIFLNVSNDGLNIIDRMKLSNKRLVAIMNIFSDLLK